MSELALLDKISGIFIDEFGNNSMIINGKCHICKKDTTIEIAKTSGGFGINGGIFRVFNQEILNIICVDCHKRA